MAIIYEPAGRAREYAALAANLYSGCTHGCKYCYVPEVLKRTKEEFHAQGLRRAGVMAQLRKDCINLYGQGSFMSPVLLSFTTDPYQPADDLHQLTRMGINLLHEYGLKVELLTKGGLRAERDFDLLGPGDALAATLTFLDPAQSQEWEPGAALPHDRIDSLIRAHARGITTWASLEPVIDPEQSLEIIRQTNSFVNRFKVGKLNHHPLAAQINWRDFGFKTKALLEKLGCNYYLKDDLRAEMAKQW